MILSRLSIRSTATVALLQIALAGLLALLITAWLHIPDASVFDVVLSFVFALLIALLASAAQSALALWLTDRGIPVRRIAVGTATVLAGAILWSVISLGIDHLSDRASLWAGYLNSRSPASLRSLFSFDHIHLWLSWLWSAWAWIAAALIASVAFAVTTCTARARGLLAILCSRSYWLSLLLLVLVGAAVTGTIVSWTPGHGLRVETLSLILRLLLVIALNAVSIALLLQAMARAVLRVQPTGAGEPEMIQPRTAEIP